MTAAELRIGNSVFFNKNHNEIGNITSIETFLTDQFKVGFYNRIDIKYYCDEIKPIPITEEWLLKFDFRFNDLGFEDLSISFGLISKDFHFVIGNYYVPLKHVHQLQNLYHAITRTELQIKEI